jgi:Gaa1-like, GPI transamidase component
MLLYLLLLGLLNEIFSFKILKISKIKLKMIRNLLGKALKSKKFYKPILRIGYLVAFIFWITIPLFPMFGDKDGFVEKAITISSNPAYFFNISTVDRHREELKKLQLGKIESTIDYIRNIFRAFNMEPFTQKFLVKIVTFQQELDYEGFNIHAIYNAKRADSRECNIIAFDHSVVNKPDHSVLEIAFALGYLESLIINHQDLNTISRDLLFLAYDGRYKKQGKAIKDFLDDYYNGRTVGFPRCGVIRQAVSIDIESDSVNKIALLGPGLNSKVSDYDYYSIFKDNLQRHAIGLWTIDEDIRIERHIQRKLSDYYYPLAYKLSSALDVVLPPLDATYTLSTIKNYAFGRSNDAHSYFIENGIHAVTLKAFKCVSCSIKPEKEVIISLGKTVEAAQRSLMALQEQLHAGSRMYMVTSLDTVMMLKYVAFILVIPIVLVLRAIKMHYDQKGDRRYRKVVTKHLGTLFTLYLVYKTDGIMQWGYRLFKGKELHFCLYSESKHLEAYPEMVLGIYLATTTLIYGIGSRLFPKLIRKCLPGMDFSKFSFENWKSKQFFHSIYLGLGIIIAGIANIGLGLIGVYLVLPVMFFVRPLSEGKIKTYVHFLLVVAWFVVIGSLLYYRYENGLDEFFKDVRKIILSHSCNSSDFYKFFIFFIVPTLIFIKQILFFKNRV